MQVAISSSSSAYILQKGAEMMSLIKAPFKRKSMPPMTTTTPEKTPRAKRASSATRSLNNSLAASSSVNSLEGEEEEKKDSCVVSSTNQIVVLVDGEEVRIRDKDSPHWKAIKASAAAFVRNNTTTIEVDDSDAFPEESPMNNNNSKNNLLTISSIEELMGEPEATMTERTEGEEWETRIDRHDSDKEDNKSVSEVDDDEGGAEEKSSPTTTAKSEDQVTRAVKVARLKKKLKTKVLGLGNQLKETQQQLRNEDGNEMANKMMKYFSKGDTTFENDKLISDDASSSKMNSPVHHAAVVNSPTGAKRKQKSKKARLRLKSPLGGEKNDHLIDEQVASGGASSNKSIRNVIFSSFRNYTKSSGHQEDHPEEDKKDQRENDYLQPIEVKQKSSKGKSTMKKNFKSKLKRFHIGTGIDKLKTCKICDKKCRKIHPSRTVLDFKKELTTEELFESEFCSCINSISIKNFSEEYFEEIDDDEDINIKNHLYSEIDGVSKGRRIFLCTWTACCTKENGDNFRLSLGSIRALFSQHSLISVSILRLHLITFWVSNFNVLPIPHDRYSLLIEHRFCA